MRSTGIFSSLESCKAKRAVSVGVLRRRIAGEYVPRCQQKPIPLAQEARGANDLVETARLHHDFFSFSALCIH